MEQSHQMNRPISTCGDQMGTLPGCCAPLAFPYIPKQEQNPSRFPELEALQTGTLFPGLDLPFKAALQANTQLENTALVELMALDFAAEELGLYLDTHPQDQEALASYRFYLNLAQEGRERYQKQYGPLVRSDLSSSENYIWSKSPWPWEEGVQD